MLPVLFRVLLTRFFTLLFLSAGALLGLLLTTRFYEIAQFAAFGGIGWPLLYFVGCQIPYILPIVIPVGVALSSFFLFRELSYSGMITSLRASSLSLKTLLTPLLLSALFLCLINGLIVSELAPQAKMKARILQREWRGINPLALLKQKDLLLNSGIEVIPLGEADPSSFAEQVVAAVRQPGQDRILLLTADRLDRSGTALEGEHVSSFLYGEPQKNGFSDLYIDKSNTLSTNIEPLSLLLTKERSRPSLDFLTTPQWIEQVKSEGPPLFPFNKLLSEGFRRLTIALSPFTFALLGAASGVMIGRKESAKPQLVLLLLTALFLTAFFFGKSFDQNIWIALPFFIVPHLLIVTVALRRLTRISRGIE